MVVKKSLSVVMMFEQKPEGSEGASHLDYLGEEHSRQREQQVHKSGDGSRPERLERLQGQSGWSSVWREGNRSEVVGARATWVL